MAEIEGSKITDITGGSELDKMDARAKAAVVVVSLGADRASQIYKYLSEQEIEDLTYEVAKLGKTNNAQVENVGPGALKGIRPIFPVFLLLNSQ